MLCDAESDLRKDYDLLGEVDKVTLLERFAALLAMMGFSGIGLQVLTIAITVYIEVVASFYVVQNSLRFINV